MWPESAKLPWCQVTSTLGSEGTNALPLKFVPSLNIWDFSTVVSRLCQNVWLFAEMYRPSSINAVPEGFAYGASTSVLASRATLRWKSTDWLVLVFRPPATDKVFSVAMANRHTVDFALSSLMSFLPWIGENVLDGA